MKSFKTNGLYICSVPKTADFRIVPLKSDSVMSWVKGRKPTAAINGSFFKWTPRGRVPIGTIVYNGKYVQNAGNGYGFGIAEGKPSFGEPWAKKWENYITGTPPLIRGGKPVPFAYYDKAVYESRSKRSAIGAKGDEIYFIASEGMTMKEFQNRLEALELDDAVNLDGGGSSCLAVDGEAVNHPTEDRRIANLICAYENADGRIRCICTEKTETYTADGAKECGRYISKGDAVLLDREITDKLLVKAEYPVRNGTRTAYVKLNNFGGK